MHSVNIYVVPIMCEGYNGEKEIAKKSFDLVFTF